jgi:hypothetical protein
VTFGAGYCAGLLNGNKVGLYQVITAASFNPIDNTMFVNNSEVFITGFYVSA